MNFYCRSYCLLNMFRAPLCPSSGAREYYTSGFCLSYFVLGFQVVGMVWSWGLCVRFAGCSPQTGHVEQAIRSAIKIHLLRLVGILFPHVENNFSFIIMARYFVCNKLLLSSECVHQQVTLVYKCIFPNHKLLHVMWSHVSSIFPYTLSSGW
jgi:hypothetical protein